MEKVRHLKRVCEGTGAKRLSDLTPDVLARYLKSMEDKGLSARTINFCRQIVVAFMNWCHKRGRVESHSLKNVARRDERKDRRWVRRPLTDDELSRLLTVAEPSGRKLWYLTAVLAGLRKSDLCRLTWGDVDFNNGCITVRDGKAKREDVIPLHPQLAYELRRVRSIMSHPKTRVFPHAVGNLTRQKDFLQAGLAYKDAQGKIRTADQEGWVIDLHAMRTTLARQGVAPTGGPADYATQRLPHHAETLHGLGTYRYSPWNGSGSFDRQVQAEYGNWNL